MPLALTAVLDVHDTDRAEQIKARVTEILTAEFNLANPHLVDDLFPAPQPIRTVPEDHDTWGDPQVIGLCPNPVCAQPVQTLALHVWECSEHTYHPKHGPTDSDYSHTYAELLCCTACDTPITMPTPPTAGDTSTAAHIEIED